ncbi:hypothetical protein [Treponema vincentii]|uniref:hypothetical protein n=1 Tax=Treponema vincentii TaxID=69710 RepID=UPI0020A4FD73|nr:hypothetical protein [Treponema vincentii]UTC47628.1 hypothetical protein E4N73_01630 [Treponema vincentii]
MSNPLVFILEKADLAGFQKELEKTQQSALDIRLDGVNLFTAIILCNAPVDTKLKLFTAAKRQYLTEHDDIQRYIDEELEAMTPGMKEPVICKAILFMCRHLPLMDIETLLTGLKQEGVVLSEEDKENIKMQVLEHNQFAQRRIKDFFEQL